MVTCLLGIWLTSKGLKEWVCSLCSWRRQGRLADLDNTTAGKPCCLQHQPVNVHTCRGRTYTMLCSRFCVLLVVMFLLSYTKSAATKHNTLRVLQGTDWLKEMHSGCNGRTVKTACVLLFAKQWQSRRQKCKSRLSNCRVVPSCYSCSVKQERCGDSCHCSKPKLPGQDRLSPSPHSSS